MSHKIGKTSYFTCICNKCNHQKIISFYDLTKKRNSRLCAICNKKLLKKRYKRAYNKTLEKKTITDHRTTKQKERYAYLSKIDPTKAKNGILYISSKIEAIKSRAKKRNKEWALDYKEVANLISKPCDYCGLFPQPYHGIDRLDSNKGYIKGNVVSCCKYCNVAKNDRTVWEFSDWVKRVYKFLKLETHHS
jgi:hypothetical protein